MTVDIVERLRRAERGLYMNECPAGHECLFSGKLFDAADEIERLRAELAAEREKAVNYASIKRAFAASLKSNDALREKAEGLSEAVWAMLRYMGDDKETFDDLLAPDEWIELARDVRYALARIDAALKGDGDE